MLNQAASTRCSVDNKEKLSTNIRSEYASDFCHDRKSAFSLFLAFQAIRKSLKYVEFRLTTNQDLFQARSSVKFGESLPSVLHLI